MNFTQWLENIENGIPTQYVKNGMVNLYRFSQNPKGQEYLIDPSKAKANYYSKREFNSAGTPRTFFYLDISDKESFIGDHLYLVQYPANKIYNLLTDPLDLKSKSLPDFDKLFDLVKQNGYHGVYYKPGFPVVSMFVPVKAVSIDSKQAA